MEKQEALDILNPKPKPIRFDKEGQYLIDFRSCGVDGNPNMKECYQWIGQFQAFQKLGLVDHTDFS